MAQGLRNEVIQGIFGGLLTISCVVFIGSQVATSCHPDDGKHAATTTKHEVVTEDYNANGPAAVAKMRKFEITADKVAKGKADFALCAGCHGAEGGGNFGVAPTLNSRTFLEASSDDFLFNTIKKGRKGTTMMEFGASMKDAQIENIIVFLRDLNKTEPAKLDESPLKGDAAKGKKLFADTCAGCHGVNGAGYAEIPVGTGIGRRGFLGKTSNGFLRYIGSHGKTATSMKPMMGAKTAVANLSVDEFESIIKHLRENAW